MKNILLIKQQPKFKTKQKKRKDLTFNDTGPTSVLDFIKGTEGSLPQVRQYKDLSRKNGTSLIKMTTILNQ